MVLTFYETVLYNGKYLAVPRFKRCVLTKVHRSVMVQKSFQNTNARNKSWLLFQTSLDVLFTRRHLSTKQHNSKVCGILNNRAAEGMCVVQGGKKCRRCNKSMTKLHEIAKQIVWQKRK